MPTTAHDRAKIRLKEPVYIACDFLDLTFYKSEIQAVKDMWKNDMPLGDIAARLKSDPDEITILIMDLARKNHIPMRDSGVYGTEIGLRVI